MNIGNEDLGLMSPNNRRPKDFLLFDMFDRELKTLPRLALAPDRPSGDHDNILENLFREVPMLHAVRPPT